MAKKFGSRVKPGSTPPDHRRHDQVRPPQVDEEPFSAIVRPAVKNGPIGVQIDASHFPNLAAKLNPPALPEGKYIYQVVEPPSYPFDGTDQEDDLKLWLNVMGGQGWQLVGIETWNGSTKSFPDVSRITKTRLYIFMRPR